MLNQTVQSNTMHCRYCNLHVPDNGAFSVWRKGGELDYKGFVSWVKDWHQHPGFDWALIPDVIDGTEGDNDYYLQRWPDMLRPWGVPVWHLHESLERLRRLTIQYFRVALGSSGQWATPGTPAWWRRIAEALETVCDSGGRPQVKLHGLRMLDTDIFTMIPFASADSCNAAVNAGSVKRFGMYTPPTAWQRAEVIAARIEMCNSAHCWIGSAQAELELGAM